MLTRDEIIHGESIATLKEFPTSSFDFVFTSPPYGNNRKSSYNGVRPENYVDWFLPNAAEIMRVLKPDGSFILNIKERAANGERQTYVLELILEMKKQGWLWVEEYIWHKKNSYPGKWPNRFRDAWERCLHFAKQKRFRMYQEAVMVPMGDWSKKRLTNLSARDKIRHESRAASGFGRNVSNWLGRDLAYPTNVLHLPTVCSNKNHAAAFPVDLPTWFIRLFTAEGDLVLDPFVGSGTTPLACIRSNRHFVGIEISQAYAQAASDAVAHEQRRLMAER